MVRYDGGGSVIGDVYVGRWTLAAAAGPGKQSRERKRGEGDDLGLSAPATWLSAQLEAWVHDVMLSGCTTGEASDGQPNRVSEVSGRCVGSEHGERDGEGEADVQAECCCRLRYMGGL